MKRIPSGYPFHFEIIIKLINKNINHLYLYEDCVTIIKGKAYLL